MMKIDLYVHANLGSSDSGLILLRLIAFSMQQLVRTSGKPDKI